MAKKNNKNRDHEDGVVRLVTDETPTIQAVLPTEQPAPESLFDALIEPAALLEEASALAPPMTLEPELSPAAIEPPVDTPSPMPTWEEISETDTTGSISHEVIVIKPTEPYPSSVVAEDLFNPRVWELEQRVQDLTSRLETESVLNVAKMSEMMTVTESMLQNLRACRLWSLRTKTEANILVLAHDPVEAASKAAASKGLAIGEFIEVRTISDRVIL